MTSKASMPEVEDTLQTEANINDGTINIEGNLETNVEDFQSTEEDPCLPVNNGTKLAEDRKLSASDDSLANRQTKFLEYEKIYVPENSEHSIANSKNVNRNSGFAGKVNGAGEREKKFRWSNSECERKIRKKFGLTHCGFLVGILLACATVLFLLVIVILGATWPRTPHSQMFPICTKSACLRSSALILPKLDKTKSPCEDFYGLTCGGWTKKHSKPPPTRSKWGLEEEMDLKLSEIMRGVISTLPHPTRVNSLTWKIKTFYDSCMSLDNIETDNDRPLKKIIFELGGWNVLREFSVLAWDFSMVLVRLQAEYGVTPFFAISVVPDPRNATRNILKLAPSGLGLPHPSYYYRKKDDRMASSYRRYMKDVVQLLGATSTDANSFSEDMFYFERRIAEITPSTEEQEDVRNHQIYKISALKTIAPSIPLQGILDAMFNKANIDVHTDVLVTSAFYISKISNIMATIDRSALNNYIIWNLVKEYLPYLSQTFLDIYYVYNRDMTGSTHLLERWEFCIKTLQKFMDVGLAAQLEKSTAQADAEKNNYTVGEIFNSVRQVVKESVTKSQWIDLDLYKYLISKLDNQTVQIGFPEDLKEYSYLEDYYSKLYVQKNDFFRNILYGVSFLQEEKRRRYVNPKEEYKWLPSMASGTKVTFVPSANKIIIPQRLLNKPYYEPEHPLPVLYGTLGVQISREMVLSLFGYSALYSANGSLLDDQSLIANLSLTSVDHQLKCLTKFCTLNKIATEEKANRTSLSTFTALSAVKQALKALKRVSQSVEHVHQAGLEDYDDESLFYIAYGQSLCVVRTAQQIDKETTIGNYLDNKDFMPYPNMHKPIAHNQIALRHKDNESVQRDPNGRYTVALPFQHYPPYLGDSYAKAQRRFLSLKRKSLRFTEYEAMYRTVMQDYVDQGHIQLVTTGIKRQNYYILHHRIVKTIATLTPLQVVFDSFARSSN